MKVESFLGRMWRPGALAMLALACTVANSVSVCAATLTVDAVDKTGAALPEVVVYAIPVGASIPAPAASSEVLSIAQQNYQFNPYVTPVRIGTRIKFPNFDKVEHHVKSFSSAKEFEFKLYDKDTPPPVTFDKPGIVIAYCLIHEWMRAYIYVLDTPYFAKTDAAGNAKIEGLPEGSYEVKAWHPDLGSIKPELKQSVKLGAQENVTLRYTFDLVPRKRKTVKPENMEKH